MDRGLHTVEHDRYLQMLFRQMPGAVWTTDRDLRLTYVAGRLASNVVPRAKPGMSVYDVLGTRDPADVVIASHRAALSGEPQSIEYQHRDRWYQIMIDQLTGDNGDAVGCIATSFDITEQRSVRQRLAKKEAQLEQAQRMAHIGSFEWEIPSNALTWSDELHRIYGLDPEQFSVTYEGFLERVHPEDSELTKSVIFDALRKGGPFAYEHRIIRTDGTVRRLRTRGDVIADKSGRAALVAGCCWDVTELRETMDSLKRARSLLEAAIEATADGLLVVDRHGRVSAYNRRFLTLWNIPHHLARHNDDELLAYVADQLENPELFLSSTRELYLHPERESFDVQHFKDGRVFERYSGPQRLGEQIVGRVWSFRDVTQRETLLRRAMFLADATRLLGSLDIEPALDSVAHLSVPFIGDGCAIDLLRNGLPRRLLFVTRDGADSLCPELPRSILSGHSVIYSTGARSCMSVPLVVKGTVEGAMTFLSAPMRRYRQADLDFAEALARRAALSLENAELYRKAQEALQSRDEFLTIAAHEIRGPITSVHMAIQGLQNGKASSADKARLLEIVTREDRRLGRFVDELLDLGSIRHGHLYFTFEELNLAEIVREAANGLAAELTKSGSSLSIMNEGHPVGQWDRHRLLQVATNLLSNAIKFGEGQPIFVGVKENKGKTTLTVKDEGIGIQPEMLDRIFQPFERAVSIRNYGGLGLGLFITRTIVEGLGGTIRVDSTPKRGSTFTVELPNARTL